MKKLTVLVASALAALSPAAADAATFVLHASTLDGQQGLPITYDAVLTTGDATTTTDGDTYQVLGATGTAAFDGLDASIVDAFGSFTLSGGAVAAIDTGFFLSPYYGFGSIQKGLYNFVAVSEVAGPLDVLTITPQLDAAVPEPATWAMLIGGFGAVGATMRRRRVRVAFA